MNKLVLCVAASVTATGLVVGCATTERSASPSAKSPSAQSASGLSLWASLQAQDYQNSWKMWPGKKAFYKGLEPHGALLTTYVNGVALEAIQKKKGTMGPGAIVVKENYMPAKELAAITVMWKVPGYNPDAGDWFWVKYKSNGVVEKEGKVAGCIGCHGAEADNDYLFTGSIQPAKRSSSY